LDIARIVAVLAVVMIHCSASFVTKYKPPASEFLCGNLFDSIARIGVPLFLMISGSLFLDERKKITLKSIMTKNVIPLVIITVVWSIIYSITYNVIFPLQAGSAVKTNKIISSIVNGHYHMWYLYMIIGLYTITPFLKKFVCKENKNMVLFFILFSFAVKFLPPAIDKLGLQSLGIGKWIAKFYLDFFDGYITYFLLGWYIVHVGIRQKYLRYVTYFLSLASLSFMVVYVNRTRDYKFAYENIGVLVFVYSLGVFLAITNLKINFKEITARILEKLSQLTFGVYIIHVIVLAIFKKILPYSSHCVIYLLGCFTVVICVSFLVSYILSKIPVLKKIIKA